MKFIQILFLTSLLLFSSTFSQQVNREDFVRCYTVEVEAKKRAKNPNYESVQDFENWMADQLKKQQASSANQKTMVVKTIPTVVHVIYSNAAENISDAQVLSQIDVLNADFRRTNVDAVNTPAAFLPDAADTEYEFCLVQTDPNGNLTNGINRVSMAGSPFSDTYVDGTIKTSTQWDPNDYFNVWVANLSGGLLGWAQFPSSSGLSGLNANGGAANTDGVVLLHSSVGEPPANPFPGPYNLGRTATHEVGHWIGLRHIWGDGPCGDDDFCADTPESDAANYSCASSHTSCSSVDMFENYMDYTDDACMNLFTLDQKARMDVVMGISPRRASLLLSGKCSPPTAPPVASFTADNTTLCPGSTVNFTDLSVNGATSWAWSFPGGTPSTSTAQNPSVTYASGGLFSVTLTVTNAFGNDVQTITNYIDVATGNTEIIFGDDFESGSFTTMGWTIENPDAQNTFQIGTVTGNSPGTTAAFVDTYNNNFLGERDAIVSPVIDMSGHTNITLDFEHAHRQYSTAETDSLVVTLSTDGGATWPNILFQGGENGSYNFATGAIQTANFVPSSAADWCGQGSPSAPCTSIPLTAFQGQSNVKIKFEVYNDYGNSIFVDNIKVSGQCAVAAAPIAEFISSETTGCSPLTANFSDQSTNIPTTWNWTFSGPATIPPSTSANPVVTFTTPGVYAVTLNVTNGMGSDVESKPSYIVVHPNPSVSTGSISDETCGANNGSATASSAGGTNPMTYSWSTIPMQTTAAVTNLSAGAYTVTVTDANGCTSTDVATIINTPGPTAVTSGTDPTCLGGDGIVSVTATGGTGTYTYSWSNTSPTATAASVSGLNAGSYSVIVTDQNGCSITESVTLASGNSPTLTVDPADDLCGAGTGTAIAVASGGAGNFSYLWSTIPAQTGPVASGLTAGTYTVTVTDILGCEASTTFSISNIAGPIAGISTFTDPTCGAANGSVSANVSGGSPGYTYIWNTVPPTSGITANDLPAGTYEVSISDNNGCISVASQTIVDQSSATLAMGTGTDETCGLQNGSLSVNASGNGPFSYAWNTSPLQVNPNAVNLPAGIYQVSVTDINGCVTVETGTVSAVAAPSLSTTSTPSSCSSNDGTATVSVSGGTNPLTYLWGTSPFQTTSTAINLGAGIYSVTVTDASGCVSVESANVSSLNGPVTSISGILSTDCDNPTGSATINHTGGTGNVVYTWGTSPPQSTATVSGLSAGVYNVSATDDLGCVGISSVTITEFTPPTITDVSTLSESCSLGNGGATATANGGNGQYSFQWSTLQTGPTISGLTAGGYSVTVTDSKGCEDIQSFSISNTPGPNVSIDDFSDSECNGDNGTATVTVGSGTAPFSLSWSTNPSQTGYVATGLGAGTYTVTIADANGCSGTDNVTISDNGNPAISIANQTDATCGGSDGMATLEVNGGTAPYSYDWGVSPPINGPSGTNLMAGTYIVNVSDASGCTTSEAIVIAGSAAPESEITSTNDICGSEIGTAEASVTGGMAPYTYLWGTIPSQTTSMATNLSTGTYSVTVTDANGCTSVNMASVSSTPELISSITNSTDANCGTDNGTAVVGVSSGVPPYTFNWNTTPAQSTAMVTGLAGGTYEVMVSDQFGCESISTVVIGTSDAPDLSVSSSSDVVCNGSNNGTANVSASGGGGSYSYQWNTSPVQTTSFAVNLGAGTYTCVTTDANGCTASVDVMISEPTAMALSVTQTPPTPGNSDGTATADATGGTAPYSYLWSDGTTSSTASNLMAGSSYAVTITDANGCSVTDEFNFAVGIANDLHSDLIKIYPNPSNGLISVETDFAGSENLSVIIYNKLGQRVFEEEHKGVSKKMISMDLSRLATGVYHIFMQSENVRHSEKLVLRK